MTRLPALPLTIDGARFGVHRQVPEPGADTREVLRELGCDEARVDALIACGAVG